MTFEWLVWLLTDCPEAHSAIIGSVTAPEFKETIRAAILCYARTFHDHPVTLKLIGFFVTSLPRQTLRQVVREGVRECRRRGALITMCVHRSAGTRPQQSLEEMPGLKAWLDNVLIPALVREYMAQSNKAEEVGA